jgi:hypothetical protein
VTFASVAPNKIQMMLGDTLAAVYEFRSARPGSDRHDSGPDDCRLAGPRVIDARLRAVSSCLTWCRCALIARSRARHVTRRQTSP